MHINLFINACVREASRTRRLAGCLLEKIGEPFEEVRLEAISFPVTDAGFLAMRDRLIGEGRFQDPVFDLANRFAAAERIVIAAPYWDLSFPAVLKCYLETICVNGLTFRYNEQGIPEGLCKAEKLVYVTTAGGFIPEHNFGYDHVKQLCADFFGIPHTVCIKAEGLDIYGTDVQAALQAAKDTMHEKICGSC